MKNENRTAQESKRVPVHATKTMPIEQTDPNFYYRWCADYDTGKLAKYKAAGYEYVKDDKGERIMKPGKYPLYLMKLPKKYRDEDLLAKRDKIITINKTTQKTNSPKGGIVPEYIPKGQDSVLTRDDL